MAKNERQIAAQGFLSQVSELASKPEVHVTNLNLEDRGDLRLALTTLLRGKNVDDYFLIVGGLFEAYDKAKDRVEQDRLQTLSSTIMSIGEDNLGIDWGRIYYEKKLHEGKTKLWALRCLKRQLSNRVFQTLKHEYNTR